MYVQRMQSGSISIMFRWAGIFRPQGLVLRNTYSNPSEKSSSCDNSALQSITVLLDPLTKVRPLKVCGLPILLLSYLSVCWSLIYNLNKAIPIIVACSFVIRLCSVVDIHFQGISRFHAPSAPVQPRTLSHINSCISWAGIASAYLRRLNGRAPCRYTLQYCHLRAAHSRHSFHLG